MFYFNHQLLILNANFLIGKKEKKRKGQGSYITPIRGNPLPMPRVLIPTPPI